MERLGQKDLLGPLSEMYLDLVVCSGGCLAFRRKPIL